MRPIHKRFYCHHCGELIYPDGQQHIHEKENMGFASYSDSAEIESYVCNECGKINIFITTSEYDEVNKKLQHREVHCYPIHIAPVDIEHVPSEYLDLFNQARYIQDISPKASAIVCRRTLEMIFEKNYEELFDKKDRALASKIKKFIDVKKPDDLTEKSMYYILNAGNAVAHKIINNEDKIIDVSFEECKQALKSIKNIFEGIFVKPEQVKEYEQQMKSVKPKAVKK